jgi:hypothetical protein
MRTHSWFIGLLLALVGFSNPALASTDAVNASSVSTTLRLNVTVQRVTLKPVQGAATSACGVHTSDYSMSFGRVGAAAINMPLCGSELKPMSSGGSPAAHYTVVTPVFTNHAASTASGIQSSGYVGVTARPTKSRKATVSAWDAATVTHTITAP